jgi:sRNA-binding regulator protein Hfq
MAERMVRSRDPRRLRKPKPDASVRARADELIASGMPYQMAMAVAHGRMELNEALERMARKDRVNALMDRHQLSRALATQIALGHADLEQVLARRRLDVHRTDNRDRSCLLPGARLALVLHDGRTLKGVVGEVEPYQLTFTPDGAPDGSAPEQLHKLKLLYAYAPEAWKAVKKGVRSDKKASDTEAPAVRPQDRYSCSDRRLFGYLDRGVELNITLLDKSVMRGTVVWFGRYEFGLKLRTDGEVTVFRHALRDVSPAES